LPLLILALSFPCALPYQISLLFATPVNFYHFGLPLYEGYDDLNEMQLTFLTLPSGETVTLGEYLNCPQPGTSIYVDAAMQNIPQIVFDSCLQLQVSREEAIWFNSDWQDEIDRLYAEHGDIEKRPESSPVEELTQNRQYEPIDCFNHALRIYTREYAPATYWAMLQHNLGLAYFNRIQGDRRENLERSIECFNKSLEIFTQDDFPEKWRVNQEDLAKSQRSIGQILVKDILNRPLIGRQLKGVNLSDVNLSGANLSFAELHNANLSGADLSSANLRGANLRNANLSGTNLHNANLSANLSDANVSGADLSDANLIGATLGFANLSNANVSRANLSGAKLNSTDMRDVNLIGANVKNARFSSNLGISEFVKEDLIERGAIFEDALGDRSESKTLVPH
jgi:uncharacterized protein YjbI with pentapeptide repeats